MYLGGCELKLTSVFNNKIRNMDGTSLPFVVEWHLSFPDPNLATEVI